MLSRFFLGELARIVFFFGSSFEGKSFHSRSELIFWGAPPPPGVPLDQKNRPSPTELSASGSERRPRKAIRDSFLRKALQQMQKLNFGRFEARGSKGGEGA